MLCRRIKRDGEHFIVHYEQARQVHTARVRYVVGANGAHSMVRRWCYPSHEIRRYLAVQQWFDEQHAQPFYSCLFDNSTTDCYAWSISKDGHFIFGGAFTLKDANQRYAALKDKLAVRGFVFGEPIKTEKCSVLFPSRWQDFVCGQAGVLLIGETAGFISASSLEGISYALDNTEILSKIFNAGRTAPEAEYWRRTRTLRLKLLGKIVKSRLLTSPLLRFTIMKRGVSHIPSDS